MVVVERKMAGSWGILSTWLLVCGVLSASYIHSPSFFNAESMSDTFELFDLKVEVVCPPGKRILCGAKEGDYFTLQGEMLHLPPNQGISIYSLCEYRSSII